MKVNLYFEEEHGSNNDSIFIISKWNLKKFVQTQKELYFDPGINPHAPERGLTARIKKITAQKLLKTGPFWWTTPGLMKNCDPHGVPFFIWNNHEDLIWEIPS